MARENSSNHDVLAVGLRRVGRDLPATAAKTVRQIGSYGTDSVSPRLSKTRSVKPQKRSSLGLKRGREITALRPPDAAPQADGLIPQPANQA